MNKLTKHSLQWFYNLLEQGECDILDFKEHLDDKLVFGKSTKNYAPKYDELSRDVVAFANYKGGFILFGIIDKTKALNRDFKLNEKQTFNLISQIQDRTFPSITLKAHRLQVEDTTLLVLEIPFTKQIHRTSKGEYLIRSNDGNRAIEPYEFSTIQAEKEIIIFDQKVWDLELKSTEMDKNGYPVPGWQSLSKTRELFSRIKTERPDSPYLKKDFTEFADTLGLIKEENKKEYPTTTGILFIGTFKALKEIPFNQINYVRFYNDDTYTPFEYNGNLTDIIDDCFKQLKSEIKVTEFHFGLFREYIEDYPEVVIRELLVNAVAHRDYSRQQLIEIRKYPDYLEIESPGRFPAGVNEQNYLKKTNPRNPRIIDILRELKYAEKAGSGFDKIFTTLLSQGKSIPEVIQTEHSLIFRVNAEVNAHKIAELALDYKRRNKEEIGLDKLLVLKAIYSGGKVTFQELSQQPFINEKKLRRILEKLESIDFIEKTGKTSGMKYIIHKSKLATTDEKINYSKQKKQAKERQKEAILRYLDSMDEIDNESARKLLNLSNSDVYYVSRLFAEMKKSQLIKVKRREHRKILYKRIR